MTKETVDFNTTDDQLSRVLNRVAELPIASISDFTQCLDMLIKHHGLFSAEGLRLVNENILRFVGDLDNRRADSENVKRNSDRYLAMEREMGRALAAGFAAGSVIRNLVEMGAVGYSHGAGFIAVANEAEEAAADLLLAYSWEDRIESKVKAA